jgi:hypothetical protein
MLSLIEQPPPLASRRIPIDAKAADVALALDTGNG